MADALFDLGAPDWTGDPRSRITDAQTAGDWIARYHYSGKRNPSSTEWGIFAPDLLAVVSVGEPANVDGVAKKYDLAAWPGNKEITRVAVHPDAPKNTATLSVAMVCRQLGRKFDWLFSYADTGQGHHGGIYQGLNAVYVGLSAALPGWLLDGEPVHPRTVVATFGTQAADDAPRIAAERGQQLVKVQGLNTAKHLYIVPIGRPATRAAIRRHLRRYAQPYPKREA